MEPLAWETDPPDLRSPILVCSFRGWNDAAASASTALQTVAASLDAEVVAQVDPDDTTNGRLVAPDQLGGGVLVSAADSLDQLREPAF